VSSVLGGKTCLGWSSNQSANLFDHQAVTMTRSSAQAGPIGSSVSAYGIVAAGEVRGPVEADADKDARYRKMKWLTPVPKQAQPLRALSASEIKDAMGFGFWWAKTMKPPYLNAEESDKLLTALLKKLT
jgi:hypothetical protein